VRIKLTSIFVEDQARTHRRLRGRGVVFTREPTDTGPVRIAILADTCGNLVQLYQKRG
jgi:predicted enzyme related to lactoylglutathione lyase